MQRCLYSQDDCSCRHGLGKLVAVQHRNIEEHGFPEELHGKADALFLDLPGPWKARSLALSSVAHTLWSECKFAFTLAPHSGNILSIP